MKNIVLLSEYGASGKDFIANEVANMFTETPEIVALGAPVHQITNIMSQSRERRAKRSDLQFLAESMRDIYGEDVWINIADNRVMNLNEAGKSVIITDVRKMMEFAHYVVENDFYPLFVHVNRDTAIEREKMRDNVSDPSSLESALEQQLRFIMALPRKSCGDNLTKVNTDDPFMSRIYIINNNDTKEGTKKQLERWWEIING